jgi:hypothetical protein
MRPAIGQAPLGPRSRCYRINTGRTDERGCNLGHLFIGSNALGDRGIDHSLRSPELGDGCFQRRLRGRRGGVEALGEIGTLGDHKSPGADQAGQFLAAWLARRCDDGGKGGGEFGNQGGIDRIALGAQALGAGEVTDAGRIKDADLDPGLEQGIAGKPLDASMPTLITWRSVNQATAFCTPSDVFSTRIRSAPGEIATSR